MHTTDMNPDTASIGVSAPKRILQSVLTALNPGGFIEKSEAQLRQIVDAIPQMIAVLNRDGFKSREERNNATYLFL